jgi:hypothetical protein
LVLNVGQEQRAVLKFYRVRFCGGNYVGTRWVACKAYFAAHSWGVVDQECHAGRASACADCCNSLAEVHQFTIRAGGAHSRKTIYHRLCG